MSEKRNIASIIVIVMITLLMGACSLFSSKNLIDKFPKEQILSVVKVDINFDGTEIHSELPNEKINLFYENLKDLKYTENHNFFGLKFKEFDNVYYVITYENYKIQLSEHEVILFKGDTKEKGIKNMKKF